MLNAKLIQVIENAGLILTLGNTEKMTMISEAVDIRCKHPTEPVYPSIQPSLCYRKFNGFGRMLETWGEHANPTQRSPCPTDRTQFKFDLNDSIAPPTGHTTTIHQKKI